MWKAQNWVLLKNKHTISIFAFWSSSLSTRATSGFCVSFVISELIIFHASINCWLPIETYLIGLVAQVQFAVSNFFVKRCRLSEYPCTHSWFYSSFSCTLHPLCNYLWSVRDKYKLCLPLKSFIFMILVSFLETLKGFTSSLVKVAIFFGDEEAIEGLKLVCYFISLPASSASQANWWRLKFSNSVL